MSVRKRVWTDRHGVEQSAWIVDYRDQTGQRRNKNFSRKKDATDFAATTHSEVLQGTHVPDSVSISVREAADLWLSSGEAAGLERTSMDQRRQHVNFHVNPFLGDTLLSRLNPATIRAFEDRLRKEGRSRAMVKKVMTSLSSIVSDSVERGLAARNIVRDLRRSRSKRGTERQNGKLVVGVDIPTREEIKRVIEAVKGRWRPLILTAIFTGLRASELRGLTWADVDFAAKVVRVSQRADAYNEIGAPKSASSFRSVPMTPMLVNVLREWKLKCPKRPTGKKDQADKPISELHYVFPNGRGNVESVGNIINRGLIPTMIAAAVSVPSEEVDEDTGKPIMKARYTGLHAFRHFFASWCINSKADGGLGLSPKRVQTLMGHANINITMNTYAHLFPTTNDADELAKAERALLA